MRKFLPVSAALVLHHCVAAAGAAGPEAQDGRPENALRPGARDQPEPVELQPERDRARCRPGRHQRRRAQEGIQGRGADVRARRSRRSRRPRAGAAASVEKKAGQAYLDKAAAEKGRDAHRLGAGHHDALAGHRRLAEGHRPREGPLSRRPLTDGTVFDSSVQRGEPIVLPLNGVIRCWTEGVSLMKVGGKSRLVCPSDIAYWRPGPAARDQGRGDAGVRGRAARDHEVATQPRGTRPATARTLRGAASHIAPADTALTAIAIQNATHVAARCGRAARRRPRVRWRRRRSRPD